MKKIFFFLCLFSIVNLGFVSCSDDDNNEAYITDQTLAKEMIKGEWTVTSTSMKSNFSLYDDGFNTSAKEMFRSYVVTMLFEEDGIVETTNTPKVSGGALPYSEVDKYYFQNNKLYIEDLRYKLILEHTYQISEKSLLLTAKITKADIIKIFEMEAIISGEDYSEIIKLIPSNFSGNINYTLKR